MNAAIRAVTRTAIACGLDVIGIRRGYAGLLERDFRPLAARDVGGIIERGGTFLGSARCSEFKTEEGQARALDVLANAGIDGLIVIGGNGSQTGAEALSRKGLPVVGVASTIDNDLFGSDITIGVDTALNIAIEAIDRLRVTAASHERAFLVEVMGRDCGYLTLMAGIAGGADSFVIPERELHPETVAAELRDARGRGKTHAIVVVAEGATYDAERLAVFFRENRERLGFELRVTRLGHVQRGGVPGAFDRILASRFGATAARTMAEGRHGVVIGLLRGAVSETPLAEVVGQKKPVDAELLEMARTLAR